MTQSDKAMNAADRSRKRIDPETVVGWGVDADPNNDPTRPMRDRSAVRDPGPVPERPLVQASDVEILQSVEYLQRPAVVGLSVPPRGLSGGLRRCAFRFSESQWGHWLLLMLADRVGVVEGRAGDVLRGRPPNPLVEMGRVSRARARSAALVTGAVAIAGLFAVIVLATRRRR